MSVLILGGGIFSGQALLPFAAGDADVPRFCVLDSWLARGGQPTEAGLVKLRENGFRTVVNFRDEPDWIAWEKNTVTKAGMNYVSLPWPIMGRPSAGLLDRFFLALDQPENRPVFFHCEHGRDRSGVMAVLALMRYRGMSEEAARREAFEKVPPHFGYRFLAGWRIREFLSARPASFLPVAVPAAAEGAGTELRPSAVPSAEMRG